MTGQMVKLPEDEDTPEKVSGLQKSKVYGLRPAYSTSLSPPFLSRRLTITEGGQDLPHDGSRQERPAPCLLPVLSAADPNAPHLFAHTVSFEEFQEGSKQDPTIVQALSLYDGLV
ncbi:hypothetical protein Golomagni_07043 [Golovinomyces magnicellulatus]|nr:hypothetical protein Golomagni_07043 [Golovinomyces magnicellulatus]